MVTALLLNCLNTFLETITQFLKTFNTKPNFQSTFTEPLTLLAKSNNCLKTILSVLKIKQCSQIIQNYKRYRSFIRQYIKKVYSYSKKVYCNKVNKLCNCIKSIVMITYSSKVNKLYIVSIASVVLY